MKKFSLYLTILFLLMSRLVSTASSVLPAMSAGDAEQWVLSAFAKGKIPPFSFVYGGVPSDSFIRTWKYEKRQVPAGNDDMARYIFTYTGRNEGIKAECTVDVYKDFDAVEWVVRFTNVSGADSRQLSGIRTADVRVSYGSGGQFRLHYLEGSHISKSDYHPRSLTFGIDSALTYVPVGGRSSEEEFPFYNIEAPGNCGFVFAIGWSGTWRTRMEQEDPASVSVAAGLDRFDSYLRPEESIRVPSVCMMFWEGEDRMTGHNKFRRFLLTHICRKSGGRYAEYPLSSSFNYRDPYPYTEYSGITEEYAVAMVERYIQFGIFPDVFWLDAGWHTGASRYMDGLSWANTVGNWSVDTTRFPRGLKPVADAVHRSGAKFMVWFEPERVMLNTEWAEKHPEFLLEIPDSDEDTYRLFDLGNPEARRWMTDEYVRLIRDNGIDYYRQDFNMHPDIYWAANDEPGRTGMKEVRHIEGLYAFWDELLETFPQMLIDNCASGGRRLDMETVRRSAPLWRSDYYHYDDPDGYQGHTVGLNFFLPIHGTGILLDDRYSYRSSMSSALVMNWKVTSKGSDILKMRDNIAEYKRLKPYYYEDFYPLSGLDDLTSDKIWVVYQLHRPSDDSSVIVAFRRQGAEDAGYTVKVRALKDDKEYAVESLDGAGTVKVSGQKLKEGFEIHLDSPGSSAIFMIK